MNWLIFSIVVIYILIVLYLLYYVRKTNKTILKELSDELSLKQEQW